MLFRSLLWLMRNRLDGLAFPRVRQGLIATALASIVLAVFLVIWSEWTVGFSVWIVGLGGVTLGAAIYWFAALIFKAPEARALPKLLRQ